MPRITFAASSGILLPRCSQHGTWADHAAALRVVELIASEGDTSLRELAAAHGDGKRADELERRLRHVEMATALHEDRLSTLGWRTRVHLVLDWFDFL